MKAKIYPSKNKTATIKLPCSKSLAHRAIICASLADGISHITNVDFSVDIDGKLIAASANVSGAIKANSGRFGKSDKNCLTIDTNGNAVIPSACISELEVSKIKDSNGTKNSETVTWKSVNSITGMKIVWSQYETTYKLPTEIKDGKVTDYDSCSNLVGGTLNSNNKTFDISYTYKDVTTLATVGTDRTHTVT